MDDLDELLTPAGQDPAGRDRLWQKTRGVLRRRRWVRAGVKAAAGATCFAAGALTVWLLTPSPADRLLVVQNSEAPPREPAPPADPYRIDPPKTLERWAFLAAGEKRAALYRRAADRYLERGDEVAALRCYRQALDGVKPADLVVRPNEDTWMLMSLKFARQKEMTDVRN